MKYRKLLLSFVFIFIFVLGSTFTSYARKEEWHDFSKEADAHITADEGHLYITFIGYPNYFMSSTNEVNVLSTVIPRNTPTTETIWKWGASSGGGGSFLSPQGADVNSSLVSKYFGDRWYHLGTKMDHHKMWGNITDLRLNNTSLFTDVTWSVNKDMATRYVNGRNRVGTAVYQVTIYNPKPELKGIQFEWYNINAKPERHYILNLDVSDAVRIATTHNWGPWKYDASKHWRECTGCGARSDEGAHTLDASGRCTVCGGQFHTHDYNKFIGYQTPPSCTSPGVAIYQCSCGQTITKPVPAKGHNWGPEYVSLAPTCIANGMMSHQCQTDWVIENTRTIPALGHDYQWKWYPLNGVQNAYQQLTCTRCGATTGSQNYTKHTVTYLSRDIDNNIELKRQTKTLNRGTQVRGSDVGTEPLVYDGVPYTYIGDTSATVSGDTTVYRNYQKSYYILSYDGNGGTGFMGNQQLNYNTNFKINNNAFTRTGYTFKGWSTNKTGSVMYKDGDTIPALLNRTDPGNTVTLYAIWEANTYALHFEDEYGNVIPDKKVVYDQPYGKLPEPTSEGRRFKGWERHLTVSGDTVTQAVDSTTIMRSTEDITLHAVWEDLYWKVTYTSPSVTQTINVLYGKQTISPFTPQETGMTFKYWSISPNGSEAYDFNQIVSADMILYAVFDPNTYHIFMEGRGTEDRVYPSDIGILPKGVQTGQTFLSWYYEPELITKVKSTDKMPARDIHVYPKFTPAIYKLTLKDRPENWSLRYGDIVPELPKLSVPGKTFKGWVFQKSKVKGGDTYAWDFDVELEPLWQVDQVTIYYPDGMAKAVNKGSQVGNLPTPTEYPDKTFVGYVDQNGKWVTESTVANTDLFITYKFEAKNIVLTLHDGSWTRKVEHEAGTTATGLPARSKPGYEFKGWSLYENGAVTRGPFYINTDLYASWGAGVQDIYFTDLNRTVQRYTGQAIGSLPEVGKEGYRFKGWSDGTHIVNPTTAVPIGGMTLTGVFELIDTGLTDTVTIRYWSDGVRINTVDLIKGQILWDPGAPAVANVESRHFQYWSSSDGGPAFEFGNTQNSSLDLYAVWK